MQLEQIAIALRPRHGWEAIDLGFRMAAHWARALWTVWFALFVPIGLALAFALREFPWLAALILWWCKPVFDRFLLHVLSRSVFGRTPSLSESLSAWREILQPGLAVSLITRLWNFKRSFTLPVQQLERQQGAAARQRRRLLSQRTGGFATWLTLVCVHLEGVAMIGIYATSSLFATDVQLAPQADAASTGFEHWVTVNEWWTFSDTLIYIAAISLIEPFYVAAGFALYLNRRVLLEGWDVEVAMRRLAQRQREAKATGLRIAGLCIPLLMLGCFALQPALATAQSVDADAVVQAQSTVEVDADEPNQAMLKADRSGSSGTRQSYKALDTQAQRTAQTVILDPVFGSRRTQERWRAIANWDPESKVRKSSSGWFGKLFVLLAEVFRVLAWVGLALLVVMMAWLIAKRIGASPENRAALPAPLTLFGLAINPASLPADIPAAARAALAAGQMREALSLLYRGALSYLLHTRGVRIGRGATENDVLRIARAALPEITGRYFEQLLPIWIASAYSARLPSIAAVENLCAGYVAALPSVVVADAVQGQPA